MRAATNSRRTNRSSPILRRFVPSAPRRNCGARSAPARRSSSKGAGFTRPITEAILTRKKPRPIRRRRPRPRRNLRVNPTRRLRAHRRDHRRDRDRHLRTARRHDSRRVSHLWQTVRDRVDRGSSGVSVLLESVQTRRSGPVDRRPIRRPRGRGSSRARSRRLE